MVWMRSKHSLVNLSDTQTNATCSRRCCSCPRWSLWLIARQTDIPQDSTQRCAPTSRTVTTWRWLTDRHRRRRNRRHVSIRQASIRLRAPTIRTAARDLRAASSPCPASAHDSTPPESTLPLVPTTLTATR